MLCRCVRLADARARQCYTVRPAKVCGTLVGVRRLRFLCTGLRGSQEDSGEAQEGYLTIENH